MVKKKSGVINMIDFDDLIRLDSSDINELPNKIVRNNYDLFKIKLKERNLEPHRVNLIEYVGGICFQFNKKESIIYFEFYNDGEMGYIIEDSINHQIIDNQDINDFEEFLKIL
jgi:hypothetical protein